MSATRIVVVVFAAAGLVISAVGATVPVTAPVQGIQVSVADGDGWKRVGTLEYGKHLCQRVVELPQSAEVVRFEHAGTTAAQVDVISLGGVAPLAVDGLCEPGDLAKLALPDLDVADVTGRTFTCIFPEDTSRLLAVTARVEPRRGAEFPFAFPLANLYHHPADYTAFYSYRLGSNEGRLRVDGELVDEELGEPLFRELSRTGSGHPTAETWGWVRDDGETLYAALDFLPDNTFDGDADYAALHVRTPTGVREFRVSVPERLWGVPGFTYTSRVGYQHKVYELAVPLATLGAHDGADLELAFSAYGTAAPPQPIIDAFSEGVQSMTVPTSATVGGIGSCAAPCTIIDGERDIRAAETSGSGTLEVSVNDAVADRLRVQSVGGGTGSVWVVWDGVDADWSSNALGLYVGVDDDYSMLEVAVANPGTGPATIQLRMWTDTTGTSYYTSPLFTVAAGAALETLKLPWDAMTLTGSEGSVGVIRAFELQVTAAGPGFDVQVESVELTTGTMLPLVIDTGDDYGGASVSAPGEHGAVADGSGIWGGERDAWVQLDTGTYCWFETNNGYRFSYECYDGRGRMVWDGDDNDWSSLSFAGVALDVTGYSMLELENVMGANPVDLRVLLYSAADACSETSTTVPSSGRYERLTLPLAALVTACTAPVDLSAVKAVVLEPSNDSHAGFEFSTIGFGDGTVPVELLSFVAE